MSPSSPRNSVSPTAAASNAPPVISSNVSATPAVITILGRSNAAVTHNKLDAKTLVPSNAPIHSLKIQPITIASVLSKQRKDVASNTTSMT